MAKAEPSKLRSVVRRTAWRIRGWPHMSTLEKLGLRVGTKVFVGTGAYLDPDFCHLIELRDRVTISINVTILAHDAAGRHVVDYGRVAPVLIEEDVFIGAGAIILPGVTVGAGAIVAAGSVVIRDVAPNAIVAGNPAKPIGDRESFRARHAARQDQFPTWKRAGWTTSTGITPERIDEMRAALAEHGEGYIG